MTIAAYRPTQYYIPTTSYYQNGSNSYAPKILIYIFLCFFFIVFAIILWCAGCFLRQPNRCNRNTTSSTSVTNSTTSTNNTAASSSTTTISTTTSSSNVVIVEIDVRRVGSIDSIPVFVYSEKTMEKLECVICLGEFKDGQEGRRLPKCNHKFHLSCVDKWLFSHSTCPICRANTPASTSSVPPV
ncbi:putative transcription factor C2H2 family [Dioscorea sansibarensis]